MSMDKINCCKGCEKRSVGRHSACPEYRLERDALTKRNELQIQASLARHNVSFFATCTMPISRKLSTETHSGHPHTLNTSRSLKYSNCAVGDK